MVSFWPFGGDNTSAAGFEKILATLSTKINKASATDASLRQRQRRLRVLWTLYTCFAYVIAALILTLVTGQQNWTAIEYSGLAGGPVVIYAVRLTIEAYYNYRISNTQAQLNELQKQREQAIDKLKAATKYNSTQQLLDKYGGESPRPAAKDFQKRKQESDQKREPVQQGGRTGIAPPPTANIPGRTQTFQQGTPPIHNAEFPRTPTSSRPHSSEEGPGEEFAPNAFSQARVPTSPQTATHPVTSAAPEYAPASSHQGPKWYDRILDIVLGDDETAPKNRIVLICSSCRLVNGQAPPGTRGLDDLGKWRCMGCGGMNGTESEAKRVIREAAVAAGGAKSGAVEIQAGDDVDEDIEEEDDGSHSMMGGMDGAGDVSAGSPASSTRSKARQRRKQ